MLTCIPIILGALTYGCPAPIPADITRNEQEQVIFDQQITCLAQNIYHEARSETIQGQQAVAFVTINRMLSDKFPDTICKVVHQKNQFSWYWDGKSDAIHNYLAYDIAYVIAENMLENYDAYVDTTGGATFYHANYVTPYWAASFNYTATIGTHIFYKG